MRYAYSNEVGPEHVGRRVTVRRRLPEGGTSDTVGTLVAADDHTLQIRDKHGRLTAIERRMVVASRVIRAPAGPGAPRRGGEAE